MIIIKRDGTTVDYDIKKIKDAIAKAFAAVYGDVGNHFTWSDPVGCIQDVATRVDENLNVQYGDTDKVNIEVVQNYVEQSLIEMKYAEVAKAYILYRAAKTMTRGTTELGYTMADGSVLRRRDLADRVSKACWNVNNVSPMRIIDRAMSELYDGARESQVHDALMMSVRPLIETAPEYSRVAAALLLGKIRREVEETTHAVNDAAVLRTALSQGVDAGVYAPVLLQPGRFDLDKISLALDSSLDRKFDYIGLQTLYDRYLVRVNGALVETPQVMLMRIAMGLSLNEDNPTDRAIEFYHVYSSHCFMSSTPTLFNSGLVRAQLSSCYLSTVPDGLEGIFNTFRDNALLSKFAGGIGNDWTNVRGLGSLIKGTHGESQGTIPFLKVNNDTASAVNQGGKRKGAICSYLETWHTDIEEFLELRKNTGDERRRTHDMNTANWIPDLFMERKADPEAVWTLFSPSDVPDLHGIYGQEFNERYAHYESEFLMGRLPGRQLKAVALWRKMLTMLFETGHPWITFKDPCNTRSPQKHVGVVNCSNLCTEITLNNSPSTYDVYGDRATVGEVAVCNLGSVNLVAHIRPDGTLDRNLLQATVRTAIRMLDNVIDINFYPIPEAENSNKKHRPIGLGVMGFQDVLYVREQSFASQAALDTRAELMEAVAYFAYDASADLAQERGSYSSFEGSEWSKGHTPIHTISFAYDHRTIEDQLKVFGIDNFNVYGMDHRWVKLGEKVARGMRNSNVMAIAPTATIGNIVGVGACIEPTYQNLYVKTNLSGDFTIINSYLVKALRKLDLWDTQMIQDLKANEGSVQNIARVPADLKARFLTAFEIEPEWIIRGGAVGQFVIDQAQSLNVWMAGASGKKLDAAYTLAWELGLKTTYYLRTLSASSAEKSTGTGTDHRGVESGDTGANVLDEQGAVCIPFKMENGETGCSACE